MGRVQGGVPALSPANQKAFLWSGNPECQQLGAPATACLRVQDQRWKDKDPLSFSHTWRPPLKASPASPKLGDIHCSLSWILTEQKPMASSKEIQTRGSCPSQWVPDSAGDWAPALPLTVQPRESRLTFLSLRWTA